MHAHRTLLTAAILGAFAFALAGPVLAADIHQHAAAEPARLTLNQGKKWATDEPLRKSMAEIRAALANKHRAMHKGIMSADEYKALGTLVEARVATIVAECKLEPAADANLHLIVAALIAAADAMQAKTASTPAQGGTQAVEAINRYGRYFDHPGWKPIA